MHKSRFLVEYNNNCSPLEQLNRRNIMPCDFDSHDFATLVDLGGVPGARPPMGPNSFVFAYIFTKKHLRQGSTPPQGVHAPPMGNPGSTTVQQKFVDRHTWHSTNGFARGFLLLEEQNDMGWVFEVCRIPIKHPYIIILFYNRVKIDSIWSL